ncbi:glycoprotein endo-alpha-1,2-mannosidase [Tritrichomonas foetus]|uniref:Glycoprotein endo-alpha-1,2-mannosidase n=1 Tax=Tritrichomonas foetus TaxID=1144522 RepID=A0A1J4KFU8_9EUKA|nr:glycoprotein endo-alpha-1,2-mannosidase [Tritrichomonas foetus]|eukprot:OHT09898.1 glycoprotein endo-alpha-1,2-mannosidase [Tritrichomonas foetus]
MNIHISTKRLIISSFIIPISLFLLFGFETVYPATQKTVNRPKIFRKQVFIEYFGAFGNPAIDKRWFSWRRKIYKYTSEYYEPPNHSPIQLFPRLGLYSSHDKTLLRHHCAMLYEIGVDNIVLQWKGANRTDDYEEPEYAGYTDETLKLLLDVASEFQLKVTVRIPLYESRSNESVFEDIVYLHKKYFNHSSYLKINEKPAVFIYDPHEINNLYLAIQQLKENSINCFFVGSINTKNHVGIAVEDGFDGVFTYFASEASTWCSNISHWKILKKDAKDRGIIFIPSVGPGYNDEKIDRWRNDNGRSREGGQYYDRMWKAAIETRPKFVVINSFNNWMETTAIEPVVEKQGFRFDDNIWSGSGTSGDSFMEMTKKWIDIFKGFKQ